MLKEANDFLTQPKIVRVDETNIGAAGLIHSESWKESHRGFCSGEFVAKHTPEAQTQYLRREMTAGKALYMLVEEQPVGIVSVQGNLIENLYVLPGQQNRGWGSRLLEFAMEQCDGMPTLWVMNINEGAYRLYTRWGFTETGNRKQLNGDLYEMELARAGGADDLHRLAVRHIYGNGVQEDDGLAYAPDST